MTNRAGRIEHAAYCPTCSWQQPTADAASAGLAIAAHYREKPKHRAPTKPPARRARAEAKSLRNALAAEIAAEIGWGE